MIQSSRLFFKFNRELSHTVSPVYAKEILNKVIKPKIQDSEYKTTLQRKFAEAYSEYVDLYEQSSKIKKLETDKYNVMRSFEIELEKLAERAREHEKNQAFVKKILDTFFVGKLSGEDFCQFDICNCGFSGYDPQESVAACMDFYQIKSERVTRFPGDDGRKVVMIPTNIPQLNSPIIFAEDNLSDAEELMQLLHQGLTAAEEKANTRIRTDLAFLKERLFTPVLQKKSQAFVEYDACQAAIKQFKEFLSESYPIRFKFIKSESTCILTTEWDYNYCRAEEKRLEQKNKNRC